MTQDLTLKELAVKLGGEIRGDQVLAPGPGHSPQDRSMSVRLSAAKSGYVVNSFAGDDPIRCRDHIDARLGRAPWQPHANGNGKDRFSLDVLVAAAQKAADRKPIGKPVATYHYTDFDGTLLYDVLRYEPKSFKHRLPDGTFKGSERRVPYRLPELMKFPDATIFITEGEKDADNVAKLGACTTTVASGKWTEDCVKALADRDCWIIQDTDAAGTKKALAAAMALRGAAKSIKIVRLPGLTDAPGNNDVSDWLDQGHGIDELENVCIDTPDWVPIAEPPQPEPIDVSKPGPAILNYRRHRDVNNPTPRYLVKNLLPETGIGLLSGQSGTYKSFVALKLAGAVSMGQPFADYAIKRQGAVLIFATEGAGGLPTRLDELSKAEHGNSRLPIYTCDGGVRLLDNSGVASVIATAKAVSDEAKRDYGLPLTLIIFDTVIGAAQFAKAGDENDAAVGQKLMAALNAISHATGTFVLGIDHFGKQVDTGTRGSSAKEAAADVVLALLADKALSGEVTAPRLCVRKRRSGPAGIEHPFAVKVVELGEDEDGERISSLVVEFSTAIAPPTDDDGKWTPSLRLLRKVLMTLLVSAGEKIRPYADGPEVLAVKSDYVKAEFFKQHPSELVDTKRRAYDRAVTAAQGKELIGVREVLEIKWLWLAKQH